MMRYSSIEEVNDALIEIVEHEQIVSIDEANCGKHSDMGKPPFGNTSCTISENGHNLPLEENGVVHRDIYSGSGTIDPNGHGVEEGLHEENHDDVCNGGDDYGDGGALAIDEDEEVRVRQNKVMDVDPEEEAEFDRELRSLMQVWCRDFVNHKTVLMGQSKFVSFLLHLKANSNWLYLVKQRDRYLLSLLALSQLLSTNL